jgi:hypothetical protein
LIRRGVKYTHVLARVKLSAGVPQVRVLPPPQTRANLADVSLRRSSSVLQGFLGFTRTNEGSHVIAQPLFPFFVRRADFPLTTKFPFCKVADEERPIGSLYVLTYADFVEMGLVLMGLLEKEKSAYFMFIPGTFMKQAFASMAAIFERQMQRVRFVESQSESEAVKMHAVIARPWEFVPALQVTLIGTLGCPIPIIVPTH